MDNYTPNPFMTQPIYDPTRLFATPNPEGYILTNSLCYITFSRCHWNTVQLYVINVQLFLYK